MNRTRVALLLLLAGILAVGLWSYKRLEGSLREIRATGMQTLLNTQIEALDLWIAKGESRALELAEDPELRAELGKLASSGRAAGEPGKQNSPAGRRIIDTMLHRSAGSAVMAAHVITPRGLILASSSDALAGKQVSPNFLAHLDQVFNGTASFVRPLRNRATTPAGMGGADLPLVWVEAPVRAADGKVIAAIGLGFSAEKKFTDILKSARPGSTGEAFAFNDEGWMLSESRHVDELKRRGLLGNSSGTILTMRLVAPQPGAAGGEEFTMLTRLVATAVTAGKTGDPVREGLLLDPYTGYLGRDVVGAWRWLTDYDMGVAVEMAADEAYAPLSYLETTFAAMIVLMGLVWLSAFLPASWLDRILCYGLGRRVGPYRLVRQIGEGAISNVYLARHNLLRRPAAIKMLKLKSSSDEWVARFEREVQLTSQLHHPNTVTIYDYGTSPDGLFYYAMEYLEGLSLGDLVDNFGPVPPSRTAYILRQVCASLGEAHAQGLVHRDIKPQNIMLCEIRGERDVVKVLDFGLVKLVSGTHTRDLTGMMKILGTPLYMSPERIRNPANADTRADIYALGAVAFHLLTGMRLFETETDHDLTYQVLHVTPRRVSELAPVAIPPVLDELIARCVEKDPAARPQSVAELAEVLDRVLEQTPWTKRQIDAWWHINWVGRDHPDRRFVVESEQ